MNWRTSEGKAYLKAEENDTCYSITQYFVDADTEAYELTVDRNYEPRQSTYNFSNLLAAKEYAQKLSLFEVRD